MASIMKLGPKKTSRPKSRKFHPITVELYKEVKLHKEHLNESGIFDIDQKDNGRNGDIELEVVGKNKIENSKQIENQVRNRHISAYEDNKDQIADLKNPESAVRLSIKELRDNFQFDGIKEHIIKCLNALANEYKKNNNKLVGYFIYLFYFSSIESKEDLLKVSNGVVLCKLLKDVSPQANSVIGKIHKNPINKEEVIANIKKYLRGLKTLKFPKKYMVTVSELMQDNSNEIVNHIINLYQFICSYLNEVKDVRESQLPNIQLETKESYVNVGISVKDLCNNKVLIRSLELLKCASTKLEKYKGKCSKLSEELDSIKDELEAKNQEIHRLKEQAITNETEFVTDKK